MRYGFRLAVCLLCASSSALAAAPRSGVFCQRERYRKNILAVRVLPSGDLEFGLSKWEESQNFSLFGVAKREGSHWVFMERDPDYTYNEKQQDWDYVAHSRTREVTCNMRIDWAHDGSISLLVDTRANCPGDAGYGFSEKSSRFSGRDYLRKVTFELSDSETFLSARAAAGC